MEPNTEPKTDNDNPLYIGWDFGTTASGLSLIADKRFYLSKVQRLQHIDSWPEDFDDDSVPAPKVPSLLSFATDGSEEHRWGFAAYNHPGSFKTAWFKLRLEPNADPAQFHDGALQAATGVEICQLPDGESAETVTARFFRLMHARLQRRLKQLFSGLNIPRLEFYLTVPVNSSPDVIEAMRLAAEQAGLDSCPGNRVWIMEEPHAALLHVLKRGNRRLIPGEVIMVADLGGGTCDFAVAEVPSSNNRSNFSAVVETRGLRCGGAVVDERLYALLNLRYGASFQDLPFSAKGPGSRFHLMFENVKKKFNGKLLGPAELELRDEQGLLIQTCANGTITLETEDLLNLYEPVIANISRYIQSLQDQAREDGRPVKKIFLVGGFSASPHVSRLLTAAHRVANHVDVIQVPNPILAVANGAALRGLYPAPATRIVPNAHYGFGSSQYQLDRRGSTRTLRLVEDSMKWVLKCGESIEVKDDVLVECFRPFTEGAPVYLAIFCSNAAEPPKSTGHRLVALKDQIPLDVGSVDLARLGLQNEDNPVLPLLVRTRVSQRTGYIVFSVSCHGIILGRRELLVEEVQT